VLGVGAYSHYLRWSQGLWRSTLQQTYGTSGVLGDAGYWWALDGGVQGFESFVLGVEGFNVWLG